MARVYITGSLVDVTDTADIDMRGKYTGAIGILLSGTFSGANVQVQITAPPEAVANNRRNLKLFGPAAGTKTNATMTVAGLYYYELFTTGIRLFMSAGTVSVTDVSYSIFLKPRP